MSTEKITKYQSDDGSKSNPARAAGNKHSCLTCSKDLHPASRYWQHCNVSWDFAADQDDAAGSLQQSGVTHLNSVIS